jgi:hypothetical protein
VTHGLSDEAIFRLQLDVRRLNTENRELRKRLGITLDGRAVTLTVDNSVDTPVDTVDNSVDNDRAAYQREWAAKKRAALKNKNSISP